MMMFIRTNLLVLLSFALQTVASVWYATSPDDYVTSPDHPEKTVVRRARPSQGLWSAALNDMDIVRSTFDHPYHAVIAVVLVLACFVVGAAVYRNANRCANERDRERGPSATASQRSVADKMSITAIVLLTSYRFFTGFLNATWMSFLVAKEGARVAGERQAFFMAGAKLIFGGTILLNPVLGLANDRLSLVSHWMGRSFFLLTGISCCSLGMLLCKTAGDEQDASKYMLGCTIWMLGEAMADTTTEALVPELVPSQQFDLASSIKSLHFLLGGMFGFVAIIYHRSEQSFAWLYAWYFILMQAFAITTIAVMQGRAPVSTLSERIGQQPIFSSVLRAYVAPLEYSRSFSIGCLTLGLFSLGTAVMFFTLLMVRDVVGITDEARQQEVFGQSSIQFLTFAAISSIAVGVTGESTKSQACAPGTQAKQEDPSNIVVLQDSTGSSEDKEQEDSGEQHIAPSSSYVDESSGAIDSTLLFGGMFAFALSAALIPCASIPHQEQQRVWAFYMISGALGASFGAVYARFQSVLWLMLPANADFANALGFAAVCKVFGCGVGNFFSGFVLDAFRVQGNGEKIQMSGYIVMCLLSSIMIMSSLVLLLRNPVERAARV